MFASGLLQANALEEYSDAVAGSYLDDKNTHNNKPKRAIEGVERTNLTFADLIKTQQWQEPARLFVSQYVYPFLKRFDLRKTGATHVRVNTIETESNVFDDAVPNTTPRITSFEERSIDGGAVYFQQGIIADMYALETPEGRIDWDLRFRALTSNVANAVCAAGVEAILSAYTAFARASLFENMPSQDPAEAFARMCHYNNIVMKSEHAMTDLVRKLDGLYGGGVRALISSRETAMQILNSDMVTYVKSGKSALAMMNNIGEIRTVNGVAVDALPIVEPSGQNTTDKRWLRNMQMTWTIIPFLDPGVDTVLKNYRNARAVDVVDMETDDWHTYELDETIANTPWFHPSGELDVEYLDKFAMFATDEYHDYLSGNVAAASRKPMAERPFAMSGTIPLGNETTLPLLMFVDAESVEDYNKAEVSNMNDIKKINGRRSCFVPVRLVGELPEEYIRTEYLMQIIEAAYHAFHWKSLDFLGSILSEEDRKQIDDLAHENAKYIATLSTDVGTGTLLSIAAKTALSRIAVAQKTKSTSRPVRLLFERIKAVYASSKNDEWKKFGLYILLSRISANTIGKMLWAGIDSYLGAIVLRCEHRLMDSMLATKAGPNDKYGIVFTPGIEVGQFEAGMTYSGEHKEVKLEIGVQAGYIISDDKMFCPLASVSGSHPVRGWGGSSAGFYPQREILERTGRPLYSGFLDHVDAGRSNFAALVPYNCLIENTLPSSFAVCGYYTREMFPQYLDNSEEFTTQRRVPLWQGSTAFMFANPFLHRDERIRDPHRSSFRDIVADRSRSLLAGVGTCRYMTDKGLKLTPARHMDGVVMPGSRDRLQGYTVVGYGVNNFHQTNGHILTGQLVGAGGISGGRSMRYGLAF